MAEPTSQQLIDAQIAAHIDPATRLRIAMEELKRRGSIPLRCQWIPDCGPGREPSEEDKERIFAILKKVQ